MTGEELNTIDKLFTARLEEALKVFEARLIERLNKPQKPQISQRQAFKYYGQANVQHWRDEGLVKAVKRANKIEYLVSELEIQAAKKQLILKR